MDSAELGWLLLCVVIQFLKFFKSQWLFDTVRVEFTEVIVGREFILKRSEGVPVTFLIFHERNL
jgi:hypothetical protein